MEIVRTVLHILCICAHYVIFQNVNFFLALCEPNGQVNEAETRTRVEREKKPCASVSVPSCGVNFLVRLDFACVREICHFFNAFRD